MDSGFRRNDGGLAFLLSRDDRNRMSATAAATRPAFPETLGHPRPLWMLFMSEFWERFAFYGMRWALALYIVDQFFSGDPSGQAYASRTYGAYLALVYATAIGGG